MKRSRSSGDAKARPLNRAAPIASNQRTANEIEAFHMQHNDECNFLDSFATDHGPCQYLVSFLDSSAARRLREASLSLSHVQCLRNRGVTGSFRVVWDVMSGPLSPSYDNVLIKQTRVPDMFYNSVDLDIMLSKSVYSTVTIHINNRVNRVITLAMPNLGARRRSIQCLEVVYNPSNNGLLTILFDDEPIPSLEGEIVPCILRVPRNCIERFDLQMKREHFNVYDGARCNLSTAFSDALTDLTMKHIILNWGMKKDTHLPRVKRLNIKYVSAQRLTSLGSLLEFQGDFHRVAVDLHTAPHLEVVQFNSGFFPANWVVPKGIVAYAAQYYIREQPTFMEFPATLQRLNAPSIHLVQMLDKKACYMGPPNLRELHTKIWSPLHGKVMPMLRKLFYIRDSYYFPDFLSPFIIPPNLEELHLDRVTDPQIKVPRKSKLQRIHMTCGVTKPNRPFFIDLHHAKDLTFIEILNGNGRMRLCEGECPTSLTSLHSNLDLKILGTGIEAHLKHLSIRTLNFLAEHLHTFPKLESLFVHERSTRAALERLSLPPSLHSLALVAYSTDLQFAIPNTVQRLALCVEGVMYIRERSDQLLRPFGLDLSRFIHVVWCEPTVTHHHTPFEDNSVRAIIHTPGVDFDIETKVVL